MQKISAKNGIEIQIQHWGGNRKLSMEGIAIEYFPISIDTHNNEEKSEFHSYISDYNEKDACDSHDHILIFFIINKEY